MTSKRFTRRSAAAAVAAAAAAGLSPPVTEIDDELAGKIQDMTEAYFSDTNLHHDKAFREKVEEDEQGFVGLSVVCSLPHIRNLLSIASEKASIPPATIFAVADVLQKSSSLMVSADRTKVRRAEAFTDKGEADQRSLIASPFPWNAKANEVKDFFARYGSVKSVRLRRQKRTFQGSLFVEFSSEEEMKRVAAMKLEFQGAELEMESKTQFLENLKEENKELTAATGKKRGGSLGNDAQVKSEEEEEEEDQEDRKRGYKIGLVLEVRLRSEDGVGEEEETVNETKEQEQVENDEDAKASDHVSKRRRTGDVEIGEGGGNQMENGAENCEIDEPAGKQEGDTTIENVEVEMNCCNSEDVGGELNRPEENAENNLQQEMMVVEKESEENREEVEHKTEGKEEKGKLENTLNPDVDDSVVKETEPECKNVKEGEDNLANKLEKNDIEPNEEKEVVKDMDQGEDNLVSESGKPDVDLNEGKEDVRDMEEGKVGNKASLESNEAQAELYTHEAMDLDGEEKEKGLSEQDNAASILGEESQAKNGKDIQEQGMEEEEKAGGVVTTDSHLVESSLEKEAEQDDVDTTNVQVEEPQHGIHDELQEVKSVAHDEEKIKGVDVEDGTKEGAVPDMIQTVSMEEHADREDGQQVVENEEGMDMLKDTKTTPAEKEGERIEVKAGNDNGLAENNGTAKSNTGTWKVKYEKDVKREDLKEIFEQYGAVKHVDFAIGRDSGYVQFSKKGAAHAAVEAFKHMDCGELKVKDKFMTVRLLQGEEEEEYWQKEIGVLPVRVTETQRMEVIKSKPARGRGQKRGGSKRSAAEERRAARNAKYAKLSVGYSDS